MAMALYPHTLGDDDGPLASDHYKRAVLRAAPNRFAIEFLHPTKLGGSGSHSFGMRISPISRGDRSSVSSTGSNPDEYDVWRRWEDCLWFQDGLELEYKRSARQKRQRLLQGKGVKKHGFYLQDQASSWESLPPGPDPKSVAQDIHDYIPKLTKRGTLFRTSMATIEQRDAELQAFVEALFKEDQPALIKEMRSTRLVTDFFGYWHRDAALASKKQKSKARESREPSTASIFSSYFSTSSTPTLLDTVDSPTSLRNSPPKQPFIRSRASTTSLERPYSIASSQFTEVPASTISSNSRTLQASSLTRRRAFSVTSSESSLTRDDGVSTAGNSRVIEEVPIIFSYNSQPHSNSHPRPSSELNVLPEELCDDVIAPLTQQEPIRKKMNSPTQRRNRSYQIYVTPPETPSSATFDSPCTPPNIATLERSIRASWATIDSTSTYLEGLHIGLPTSANCRQSMASINTFLTTDSAEAVLPRSELLSENQDKPRSRSRVSVPVSLSDFDIELPEEDEIDEIDEIYDAFPRPASFIPERPETPVPQNVPLRIKIPEPSIVGPPSPTASVSTTFSIATTFSASTHSSVSTIASSSSTSSSGDGNTLSIKAALNNAIVMLRVSRDIEFQDLRQRVFNKFVGQEGVPLSKGFTIAVVVAKMTSPIAQLREPVSGSRKRSTSVTSVDNPDMRIVDSQLDWEAVAYSTEGTKLTLRILDTPV